MSETLSDRRERLLGPRLTTFYDEPVHLVRGLGTRLWDAEGREYLDCYNNVPHVGHCHPKVVEAICAQAGRLNTHTRYLHEGIVNYADDLTGTLADPLNAMMFTCTGSEANDIALRMARAVTGATGVIATDHTYHGNTMAVSQLSRTNPPPDRWDNVEFVPAPDSYRPVSPQGWAAQVQTAIERLAARGHGLSALIICPYFANEGFPDLPSGWTGPAIAAVRDAGGVIIADEVQPGFGRLGTHFWGHEKAGVRPDIVTMGKPMGNGHPVAGVVTSRATMAAFRDTFRYFNTFGGNPVSMAAAQAVLDVIREEGLQDNAREVGEYARAGLSDLATRHAAIGDVRGSGLFFGAELVMDRDARTPATAYAKKVANALRQKGVLMNFLGIHYNVLKIRPPMVFSPRRCRPHAEGRRRGFDRGAAWIGWRQRWSGCGNWTVSRSRWRQRARTRSIACEAAIGIMPLRLHRARLSQQRAVEFRARLDARAGQGRVECARAGGDGAGRLSDRDRRLSGGYAELGSGDAFGQGRGIAGGGTTGPGSVTRWAGPWPGCTISAMPGPRPRVSPGRLGTCDGLLGARPLWGRFWEHPHLSRDEQGLLETVR